MLDAMVDVEIKRREYRGKTTKITRTFRLICVLNEEAEMYHAYLTNIPINILFAEDIAELYSVRWEIELVFKELKYVYHIDQIQSANPNVVKCLILVAILALMCSRRILGLIKNVNPDNACRYTHIRWAKVFTENAYRLLEEVLESMDMKLNMMNLFDIWIGHGSDPNINRDRMMDSWMA